MANKYVFNRDSITVNGRTFPAVYAVLPEQGFSVEITVTVEDGGSAVISVPPSDRQHGAALKAAQMGLTLDADGGAADAAQIEAAAQEAQETTAAEAVTPSDADPADVETVNPAGVDADPADVETVTAAAMATATVTAEAPEAAEVETINNDDMEGKEMFKRDSMAAEAVKAAAAAEVQEMTTAAEVDAKAAHGPEASAQRTKGASAAKQDAPATRASACGVARGEVPEKTFRNEVIAGNGWSIVFDSGCNRTRVIIAEPVKAAARPIVEAAGFYYSKPLDSWNKKLTFRAYRAAVALADKLRAALA